MTGQNQRGFRVYIIDTHVHVWARAEVPQPWIDPDTMAAIDRDFSPTNYTEALEESGHAERVRGTVLVQTVHSTEETEYLLSVAAGSTRIRGVVGWVDLLDPEVDAEVARLRALAGGSKLVGIRHQIQEEEGDGLLAHPRADQAFDALERAGLAFDLVIRADQIEAAARVAAAHPRVTFVLDHLGKPPLATKNQLLLDEWAGNLRRFASSPNTFAKLSGLSVEANWSTWEAVDMAFPVATAVDSFGAERLMFGSDWPVLRLAGDFRRWLATVEALTGHLVENQRNDIWCGSAQRAYQLDMTDCEEGQGHAGV